MEKSSIFPKVIFESNCFQQLLSTFKQSNIIIVGTSKHYAKWRQKNWIEFVNILHGNKWYTHIQEGIFLF